MAAMKSAWVLEKTIGLFSASPVNRVRRAFATKAQFEPSRWVSPTPKLTSLIPAPALNWE